MCTKDWQIVNTVHQLLPCGWNSNNAVLKFVYKSNITHVCSTSVIVELDMRLWYHSPPCQAFQIFVYVMNAKMRNITCNFHWGTSVYLSESELILSMFEPASLPLLILNFVLQLFLIFDQQMKPMERSPRRVFVKNVKRTWRGQNSSRSTWKRRRGRNLSKIQETTKSEH